MTKRPSPRVFLTVAALALGVVGAGVAGTIAGTAGNDMLRGTAKADTLFGKAGNDKLYGLAGKDILLGRPRCRPPGGRRRSRHPQLRLGSGHRRRGHFRPGEQGLRDRPGASREGFAPASTPRGAAFPAGRAPLSPTAGRPLQRLDEPGQTHRGRRLGGRNDRDADRRGVQRRLPAFGQLRRRGERVQSCADSARQDIHRSARQHAGEYEHRLGHGHVRHRGARHGHAHRPCRRGHPRQAHRVRLGDGQLDGVT